MPNLYAPISTSAPSSALWVESKEAWLSNPKAGFAHWISGLRINVSRTMRDSSFSTYWAMASAWLSFLEGVGTNLFEATAKDAQAFFIKHPLEPVSRRRYLQLLDKWYWHLITSGLTDKNPMQLEFLNEYALPEHFPKGLNVNQVQQLIALFENGDSWREARDRALAAYLLGAGLRVSALCELSAPVDAEGLVVVPKVGVHQGYTGRMLGPYDISGLEMPWRRWAQEWEEVKAEKGVKSSYVVTATLGGKGLSRSGVFRRIKPLIELASGGERLPQSGPGILRNTFGRLLFCAGVSIEKAQGYLGHEQARATRRYLASSEDFFEG